MAEPHAATAVEPGRDASPEPEPTEDTITDRGATRGPGAAGWAVRRLVLGAVLAAVVAAPAIVPLGQVRPVTLALIYIVVGLSVNVLMGYLGQISLGHQAFVGVGAFTSALVVSKGDQSFFIGIAVAALVGGAAAVLLGIVALRLKGLYLALITLAYGSIAESSIFNIEAATGGAGGADAPRPAAFTTDRPYAYLCMAFVAVLLYTDWRMVRSKVGRAFFAIRDNELAAASFGINVTAYKLLGFVYSGMVAGIAGGLFAHLNELVVASDFDFFLALTFVLMVVVGGLGSRTGVVIGSAFFALLPLLLEQLFLAVGFLNDIPFIRRLKDHEEFVGAVLLLLTLTAFPGGIAQQIEPVLRWLGGGRLRGHGHGHSKATGGVNVRP